MVYIGITFMTLCFLCILVGIILFYRYNMEALRLEEKNIKNKKFELFNNIDVKATKEIIDDYIEEYVNRYAVNKFISNNIQYIREPDMNDMIRNITKNILLDIP